QGMLLIKAETGPDKLKNIVDKLDSIKGVYQTLVVMGEYDVCLIVEGVDSDDMAGKIFKIRKIEGVASTTTLTDIRESFDRVVK
ncbi:Lrp/AsnC family transcriptional regulator, partial [Candidatus Pacearchaeota archaeon]|nr:Lrp/AsnC family transcriptional regulator [Candidatus Pacearchaeota archaeon]